MPPFTRPILTSTIVLTVLGLGFPFSPGLRIAGQTATITEETRVLSTYPFSEPNPIPILTRDTRLYPYHTFEGYSVDSDPQEWKVVTLENDFIEVFVLPEVGGKVWGAVVKGTGHEFIYRNEVMKFRNISLRGPWTSGGIEFNFGVIGHTPATATPVDYFLRNNPDGSVSCFVGAMDLPSRTHWRVEIRLPADRAYFETNVLWYNPTPLFQPYYNWMTAAAFAQDDLEMFIPGDAYLEHSGEAKAWPVDPAGRYLPRYANNRFGGHKSYHVVGELNDFFGGYYHDDGYGFGHWSRYEEMPGQKLWLWALSREGGVWDDLLTDTDGQYVEFQAGRLFVQYSPGTHVNPITQARFDPGAADRWIETWFPVEGIGGLTDVSRNGVMHVETTQDGMRVGINAFADFTDTLRVYSRGELVAEEAIKLPALQPVQRDFRLPIMEPFRVALPGLGLDYSSDSSTRTLHRSFSTDPSALEQISRADALAFEASELAKGRRYPEAREMFMEALRLEPWHQRALLGLAELEYRRGKWEDGLVQVDRALQLDAYDGTANFLAGNLYRALGRIPDARDAFGWAARSMAHRSAAYVNLAEMALAGQGLEGGTDPMEAERYGRMALDYDRFSLPAREILAIAGRLTGDSELVESMHQQMLEIDPIHHFVAAERYVATPSDESGEALLSRLRSEYPDQSVLELAIDYLRRGRAEDAAEILQLGSERADNPLLGAWAAWIESDESALAGSVDPEFVFPYRPETLPVLRWASEQSDHWSWTYLLGLNLWALDRRDEAAGLFSSMDEIPDAGFAYVARAKLLEAELGIDPEADLRRAVEVGGRDQAGGRTFWVSLVQHLQAEGRWEEALAAAVEAAATYEDDFNLDLLRVRSLIHLGRSGDAIRILNATHVLPSENARESHRLFEQAHTLAAIAALGSGDLQGGREHLHAALTWPEHLGQGRPYDPEERMTRYLLGRVAERLEDRTEARTAFDAVLTATERETGGRVSSRLDLLVIPSLMALGRSEDLQRLSTDPDTEAGRVARILLDGVLSGSSLSSLAPQVATDHQDLFAGLEGGFLLFALLLEP